MNKDERIAELEANVTELEVEACRDELVISGLEKTIAELEWVSVEDRLPESGRVMFLQPKLKGMPCDWLPKPELPFTHTVTINEETKDEIPLFVKEMGITHWKPIHLPEAKPSHAGSCEHAFHKGNPCTCQPELPEAMRPILQDLVDSDVYQEVKKEIESPEPAVEVCEWKVDVDNGGFTTDCGYRHTKMHFTPTCPYCKLEIKEEG